MLYTSGTTGQSKGAMLNASSVIFLPKFDTAEVRKALPDATVMMGVPTFYTRLLDNKVFGREECRHMRLFISGSAPLTEQTFAEFEQRTGHRILERYGMTETGMITSNPLDGERVAGTVGYALPGIEVRVAGESGEPLPPGEVGSVELKGPNVFIGYWQMREKTAREFRDDGFFITGDLGTLGKDERLTLVGRSKDLIISGGLNIYPKEIESVIDELPGVLESAVIGVPHPDFGESTVAVVATTRDAPASEASIIEATALQLAPFKQPRRVILVDELPRNTMGKVQKNILRDRYAG
jgi:malonyl-CoA/methylmalonyl-CoA synthetase